MTTAEAMRVWQSHRTHEIDNENCCIYSHEYIDKNNRLVPKADHLVCEREIAWRTYVRIRDNNPNFPFTNRNWLT